MADYDLRWQQRFQNFEKAFHYLQQAMQIVNPDIIQKAGMIQFFEMTFELAWKMIKDYLEYQGFTDVKSPRAAVRKGFETGLIFNGHDWMQLLEDRNRTAHTYDEETATAIAALIHLKYYPLLKALYDTFNSKQ